MRSWGWGVSIGVMTSILVVSGNAAALRLLLAQGRGAVYRAGMIDSIICIMFRWIAAAIFVLGCAVTAGCLLASVFLAVQQEWKEFLKMLGITLLAVALAVGCWYADDRLVGVHYGYSDQSAKYMGYIFPGLVGLLFFPEPLRWAKRRLQLKRARYGVRPKAREENRPSPRVTSRRTRRR